MKILAIESSGLVAGVAVAEDDVLLIEYTMNYKKTHSQTLLPMLEDAAERIELDLQTIDAIAVTAGPGSFTGLRIGAATAKGLGLALDKPLIAVPTVDALAYNLWDSRRMVCPIMDARRSQVYTGLYAFENGEMEVLRRQCALGIDELVDDINLLSERAKAFCPEGEASGDEGVVFLGDGVPVYRERILERIAVPVQFAPLHMNRQRAASLAALAMQYAVQGRYTDADSFSPDYLRLSQAERERLQKEKEMQA